MINIESILKRVPVGTKLYCTVYGNVIFKGICSDDSGYPIHIQYIHENLFSTRYLDKYDCLYTNSNRECILFPSKDQRDWSKVKIDLPLRTPVMTLNNGDNWYLRYYNKNGHVFNTKENYEYTMKYIIPVTKFNFENQTFNEEDNYGI